MPNHCGNILKVTAPSPEAIAMFMKKVKGKGKGMTLSFNKIIPLPKTNMDIRKPTVEAKWYNWQIQHWGTKWNAYYIDTTIDGRKVKFDFNTAWDPPIPIIERLTKMFPDFTFDLYFEESGNGFKGRLKMKGGNVLINEYDGNWSAPMEDDVPF